MPSHVEFTSEGRTLRGRFYTPDIDGPWPGMVMAPGFTVTIDFPVFHEYATALAATGVAVLLFDLGAGVTLFALSSDSFRGNPTTTLRPTRPLPPGAAPNLWLWPHPNHCL